MTNEIRNQLSENLRVVCERIDAACRRSGRSPAEVTLVAVTKYAELEWVRELVDLGVLNLGESRPQQLMRRTKELPPKIHWHFVGHLQRNKAADVVPISQLIHSVDSLRLFEHLAQLKSEHRPRILLEVNVSGESSKDGFTVEELSGVWPRIRQQDSVEILGLMTMAPLSDDVEVARCVFRKLREFRDQLRHESEGRWPLNELSMGMSGDFEVGIEEGATIVRVGSRLFENMKSDSEHPTN